MNKVLIVLMSLVLKAFKPKSKFHTIRYIEYNIYNKRDVMDIKFQISNMDIVLVSDTVTDIKYFRISLCFE